MKFYYIPLLEGESLTYKGWQSDFETRDWKIFENDDYPTHRHKSSGTVFIMELIPQSRFENTKYLNMHKNQFKSIELKKSQYFKDAFNRYYMIEFEKEHNTEEYQYYLRHYTQKSTT